MNEEQFNPKEMLKKAEEASSFLKLLSNPIRLLVLCRLVSGECCVSELEKLTDISQSALSQHLAKMRDEGLVSARKDGQQVYYSIFDPNIKKVLQLLYDIYCESS